MKETILALVMLGAAGAIFAPAPVADENDIMPPVAADAGAPDPEPEPIELIQQARQQAIERAHREAAEGKNLREVYHELRQTLAELDAALALYESSMP